MFPTPSASDPILERRANTAQNVYTTASGSVRVARADGRSSNLGLAGTVMLPTPNTVDAKGGTRKGEGQVQLCHLVGGSLNPAWVEWLMGFPIGWTDCEPSETP
jgi:hypothetical protein